MTERQKIEKLSAKVKEKYPEVTDQKEIEKLIIKMQKRKVLLNGFGFLLAAAVFYTAKALLVYFFDGYTTTNTVLFITVFYMLVEAVRSFLKYPKVGKMFERATPSYEAKTIDKEYILEKHRKNLRDFSQFSVIKARLHDKNDELEVGVNNYMWHEFSVLFKDVQSGKMYGMNTSKNDYNSTHIDDDFYLIITQAGDDGDECAVGAYPASSYKLADDIKPHCRFDIA